MIRFRPSVRSTILTLAMLPILLGLGTWQLHRRIWKTDLLATIAARINAAPVALPNPLFDPESWYFRRVTVRGHYLADRALQLYGRTLNGKAGVHLLTPFLQDNGAAILIDRGFVPIEGAKTLADTIAADGTIDVEGIVRQPEPAGWFLPSSNAFTNTWYAVDIPAMSAATGQSLPPYYLAAVKGAESGWPAATGGTEGVGIRNEHLNYAIFWYSMAGVLIVIYILSSRSRRT